MPRPTCLLLRSRARQDPCRGKVSPRLSSRLTESRKRKNTINFPHHLITAAIALTNSAQSIWALAGGRLRKHSALKRSRAALARDFRLLAGEYILQVYIYIPPCWRVCACSSRPRLLFLCPRPFFLALVSALSQTGAEKGAPSWSPPFPPEEFDDYDDDGLGTPPQVKK